MTYCKICKERFENPTEMYNHDMDNHPETHYKYKRTKYKTLFELPTATAPTPNDIKEPNDYLDTNDNNDNNDEEQAPTIDPLDPTDPTDHKHNKKDDTRTSTTDPPDPPDPPDPKHKKITPHQMKLRKTSSMILLKKNQIKMNIKIKVRLLLLLKITLTLNMTPLTPIMRIVIVINLQISPQKFRL